LARAAENSGIDQGMMAYGFFAIMKTFQNFLFNGHVVELGPLGTFRVSFSCKAGETSEDCNASGIRCRRVIYNLSPRLKRELKEVEFEFMEASPPSPLPEKGGGDEPSGNADGAGNADGTGDGVNTGANTGANNGVSDAVSDAVNSSGNAVFAHKKTAAARGNVAAVERKSGYSLLNNTREGDSGSREVECGSCNEDSRSHDGGGVAALGGTVLTAAEAPCLSSAAGMAGMAAVRAPPCPYGLRFRTRT